VKPAAWLRANGHDAAGLTSQDARALEIFAQCWELYAVADGPGRRAVIVAVRALLGAMQPKFHPLVRELIARSMNWADRDRLWPLVTERQQRLEGIK
jgi:hypothetical protein